MDGNQVGLHHRPRQQLASHHLALAHGGLRTLRPQPGAHHLVNVLFHTANAVLLLVLLLRLTGKVWPAAFVAALFAWHPLHVESVAWISERKDVLSTFFALLTLLAYTRYAQKRSGVESRDSMAKSSVPAPDPRSPGTAKRSEDGSTFD